MRHPGGDVERSRALVDERLATLVPLESVEPQRLHKSIRHSLLAPGKRIRPIVTLITSSHLGGSPELAIDPACAVEMVHTASLILDDLPSMDDATLRRGRPANHVVFGEDMAMLAAFSLLNRAYDVVARAEGLSDRQRVAIVKLLAESIGGEGIIAGQESDLRLKADMQYQHLVQMHERKTGALFVGAALIGACVANLSSVESEPVAKFARNFGLAFQVLDDLLDATASAATAGKDVSQDTDKVTFVSLMGVHETRAFAGHLIESAVYALRPLGARVGPLVELAYGLLDSSPQPADGRVAAL